MLSQIKTAFHHQGFKKYFFNTGWLMADKVLRLFVGLFVGVYVARYLGPEKFGTLQFAMSFVALFGAFAKLGLDGIVVRNAVQDPDSRDELLGTAFGLRVIGGVVLLGVVFGAVQLTDSEPLTQFIVMIIAAGHVLQAFQVIEFYFQSQVLARLASIAGIAGLLVSSAIKLALIWSGASLVWFAWVFVVEHGLKGLVLASLYIKQRIPLWHWRFRLSQAKALLRDSWPLILSGLAVMIYMRIDQVMLKVIVNNEAVGNYAAAAKIAESWYFIPVMISQSLFPAVLNAKKISETKFKERVLHLFSFISLLSLIISIPVSVFSSDIILFLYGEKYKIAGSVLQIYVWAGIFVGINNASWRWHLANNNQSIAFFRLGLGALLNIVLNYIFIPVYGVQGAAIVTIISYCFAVIVGNLFFMQTRELFFLQVKSFYYGLFLIAKFR